jgi:pseudouridine synthase
MPTTAPEKRPRRDRGQIPKAPLRLQKFLSAAGFCSRRRGETLILAGRVRVNGRAVTELGTKVTPGQDRVSVDGQPVALETEWVYIALHKPKGVVTSCSHEGARVVTDLVAIEARIYPVGRLDKDSTGLLLLTNDGRLHHRLLHPSFDHEKEYEVTLAGPVADGDLDRLARGIHLDGRMTRAARVRRLAANAFAIVLQEGRNRQIRRMVRALGHRVTRLKRIRVAGIVLGDLQEGRWRRLSPQEVRGLLKQAGLPA